MTAPAPTSTKSKPLIQIPIGPQRYLQTKMSRRQLRSRIDICHLCESAIEHYALPIRPFFSPYYALGSARGFSSGRRLRAIKPQKSRFQKQLANKRPSQSTDSEPERFPGHHTLRKGAHATEAELKTALQEVRASCNKLLSQEKAPSEEDTNHVLASCKAVSDLLVFEPDSTTYTVPSMDGPASALLSLDNSKRAKIPFRALPEAIQQMGEELSQLSYSIIKAPSIFISRQALKLYVEIQAALQKPETLPEVLELYATKPVPQEGTFPIRYSNKNPNNARNAVPRPIADLALQTAINTKQLVVAMDIVETSYIKKAFHRDKFIRIALLPATGLAVAPVAAYAIASQLAGLQDTMDFTMATNVAFAGIMAYIGFTTTIGIVAITTANDQMDRVTWAPGVPLRERWIREEERAAIDKMAGAWGFRETWRRGEEEGEEWDSLREWIGKRAMILDRVSLMEGME